MFVASRADYLRATAVVALLTGGLLPTLAGVSLVLVGAAATALVLAGVFLRHLRLGAGAGLILLVYAALAAPLLWHSPVGLDGYGADKVTRLFTLTLLSAGAALTIRRAGGLVAFTQVWVVAGLVLAAGTLTGVTDAAGRAVGIEESNPIWLARALVTGVVAAGWLMTRRLLRPAWGVPAVAVLAGAAFATGSRGPLLGALLGLCVVLWAWDRLRGAYLLAVGAAAAVGAYWWSPVVHGSRLGAAVDPNRELSTAVRLEAWTRTLDLIRAHPFGVGYGGWSTATRSYPVLYPHNLFLEVASEAGVVTGLVLVAVNVAALVRLGRRAKVDTQAALLLALLATETVAVCVSGDVNARTWFFLLTLGWLTGRPQDTPKNGSELAPVNAVLVGRVVGRSV